MQTTLRMLNAIYPLIFWRHPMCCRWLSIEGSMLSVIQDFNNILANHRNREKKTALNTSALLSSWNWFNYSEHNFQMKTVMYSKHSFQLKTNGALQTKLSNEDQWCSPTNTFKWKLMAHSEQNFQMKINGAVPTILQMKTDGTLQTKLSNEDLWHIPDKIFKWRSMVHSQQYFQMKTDGALQTKLPNEDYDALQTQLSDEDWWHTPTKLSNEDYLHTINKTKMKTHIHWWWGISVTIKWGKLQLFECWVRQIKYRTDHHHDPILTPPPPPPHTHTHTQRIRWIY